MITLTPLINGESVVSMLKIRAQFFGEQPNEPVPVYQKHGMLVHTNDEITGYYVLAPYAPFAYPKPWFPDHWRPKSNFAHFAALANKSGSLHHLLSLLQQISTETDMRSFIFPLTITAFAESGSGARLLELCGFQEVTDRFYAVTITKGLYELVEHAKRTIAARHTHHSKTITARMPALAMSL
ncbi:hypothetical protein [Acidithiobacillus ferrooxidans]|uniref:hypothetical protein n=1 Tax=Acidithiobacillus ferrooxidans TaxID=920 RepID=UPI0013D715C1|nr:hypothetical protein [Acidithiobacillus ferrooxidans]